MAKLFSSFFSTMRAFTKAYKEQLARERHYLAMSPSELATLSDDELFEAVRVRIDKKVFAVKDLAQGIAAINYKQLVFFSANYLEMEVENGGLCQFFVNSSRIAAPLVSTSLEAIGAAEHKALYDGFIAKYNIDVTDLSSFLIHDTQDYARQTERYPFAEYDDAFYELKPIQDYLLSFVRRYIDAF